MKERKNEVQEDFRKPSTIKRLRTKVTSSRLKERRYLSRIKSQRGKN